MTSLFHVGVVVSDLATSVRVFEESFGFKKVSVRSVEHEYIGELIGVPGILAKIAMLEIGEGIFLELIEWHGSPKQTSTQFQPDLSSHKTQHICIYVEDAYSWHSKLSIDSNINLVSKQPVIIPIGPNIGCKVFFALVLNEVYVEIFERV